MYEHPSKVACPKCGNEQTDLFSSQPRFSANDPQHTKATGTSYVYRCCCGMYFTHEDDATLPTSGAKPVESHR